MGNRLTFLALLSLVLLPGSALAQTSAPPIAEAPYPSALPALHLEERDAIQRQLEASTQLFLHAAIATDSAMMFMLTSVASALDNSGERIDFLGANLKTFEAIGVFGGVFGGVGFLALPFAIALYLDADSRRDALDRLLRPDVGPR